MYRVFVVPDDPEAFLRAMLVPLSAARRGEPLPGVPFSREAVANAFVMLGLLSSARTEEILAEYRPKLEAKGFRMGVLTGELSVRSGAHGYAEAQAADPGRLTRIPLAFAPGPVPIAMDGMDLSLTWATLMPGGVWLRLRATGQDDGQPSRPPRGRPYRVLPFQRVVQAIQSGLSVTDDLGQAYRLRPIGGGGPVPAEGPGPSQYTWRGEMMAEPEHRPAEPDADRTPCWLEFATASGPAARVDLRPADPVPTGEADPPWPTPAEGYLAVLGAATSMTIATGGGSVELDTGRITATVADALLWVGALSPDSALLSAGTAAGRGREGWREELKYLWGRQARQRARDVEPERAGLAVRLPVRRATAVLESIAAHGDLVSVELYGHPWVTGEYWPMIAPCFQVRAVDDTGVEHEGVPGGGGGSPEGSREFWFWPPVPPAAKKIRVTVSTLWEAAWAEVGIPGRPVR
jgi:hypothetical protein